MSKLNEVELMILCAEDDLRAHLRDKRRSGSAIENALNRLGSARITIMQIRKSRLVIPNLKKSRSKWPWEVISDDGYLRGQYKTKLAAETECRYWDGEFVRRKMVGQDAKP